MIKKAMILAAGFGKRILPLTLNRPKPLLKIGEETLLSNTLKFLEQFGIRQTIVNVHYLGEQIVDYINKVKFNLNILLVFSCFPKLPQFLFFCQKVLGLLSLVLIYQIFQINKYEGNQKFLE